MTGLPCSWCGREPATERQYGWHMSGGRMYPTRVHTCDPCHDLFETERNESRRT